MTKKEWIDMLHRATRASAIVAAASCLAFLGTGCETDRHAKTAPAKAEQGGGEHPQGEHPKGEHPEGEGEHPKDGG